MEKTFIIKVDILTGEVVFENPDELSFIEVLGLLGVVNMMLVDDWRDG